MSHESDSLNEEVARMKRVYAARANEKKVLLYDSDRPEVRIHLDQMEAATARLVHDLAPSGPENLRCLDVGCGAGGFLASLVEMGVLSSNLAGTELLSDRLKAAQANLPPGPMWHLGPLDDLPETDDFDLVSTFTVFSSILDDALRRQLAANMWERTRPGGAVLIYDFRYNNPSNHDVRRVTRRELKEWFPQADRSYTTMTLAPPISRRLGRVVPSLIPVVGHLSPLRSHFWFVARRHDDE